MSRSSHTPVKGLLLPTPTASAEGARVEVVAWIAADDHPAPPATGTPATLQLGAEGLRLSAATRTWYVTYRELEGHEEGALGVVLHLAGGRRLELRTPAPNRLAQLLERRVTGYARHVILGQRRPHSPAPTSPTSHLLATLENPATAPDVRMAIARWLGTRPLERGDALYLERIIDDIADAELAAAMTAALELDPR